MTERIFFDGKERKDRNWNLCHVKQSGDRRGATRYSQNRRKERKTKYLFFCLLASVRHYESERGRILPQKPQMFKCWFAFTLPTHRFQKCMQIIRSDMCYQFPSTKQRPCNWFEWKIIIHRAHFPLWKLFKLHVLFTFSACTRSYSNRFHSFSCLLSFDVIFYWPLVIFYCRNWNVKCKRELKATEIKCFLSTFRFYTIFPTTFCIRRYRCALRFVVVFFQ